MARTLSLRRKGQSGQAMPEYIVGSFVVVAALFTPVPVFDDRAVIEVLIEAFKKNYRGYEYVMSQPGQE